MKDDRKAPIRVLIVDDAAEVRQELALLLSLSTDITVAGEASDGYEAIHQTQALHPEVILMDLEMPRMDGCKAARQIKLLLPDCRVIALTIHDSLENRKKCMEAGMEAFLTKGVRLDALQQAIRRTGETKQGDAR